MRADAKVRDRIRLAWHVFRGRPIIAFIDGYLAASWTDDEWREQEKRGVIQVRRVRSFDGEAPAGVRLTFKDGVWEIPQSGDLRHRKGHTWVED